MNLSVPGHPIHTRALCVAVTQGDAGQLNATGSILDLRKRGFCPVGSALQGMGIIHQMAVHARIDPGAASMIQLEARQPTVAFEASTATLGESCHDPVGRLAALRDVALGERFNQRLRETIGGPLGCSHIVTLAQFLNATVSSMLRDASPRHETRQPGELLFRRDLIFDGHERSESGLGIALQLSDLHTAPTPAAALAPARFGRHYEARLAIDLDGWPAVFTNVSGAQRTRTRHGFGASRWEDLSAVLQSLQSTSLGKGGTAAIARVLDGVPPIRDALFMLGPTLIQCRASFPDKWLTRAIETPGHPGLIAMADSCYMWRRGGGLEQVRAQTQSHT